MAQTTSMFSNHENCKLNSKVSVLGYWIMLSNEQIYNSPSPPQFHMQ